MTSHESIELDEKLIEAGQYRVLSSFEGGGKYAYSENVTTFMVNNA